VCVFSLALVIQHALTDIVISGLAGCTALLYILKTAQFLGEKNVIEQKMFVFIFSATFVWNFSHLKKNWES